jgi:hypothetical protein
MSHDQPFFSGAKNRQKATVPKFSIENIFYSLKSIRQTALLSEERVATCMPSAYSFNVPGQTYGHLGKL